MAEAGQGAISSSNALNPWGGNGPGARKAPPGGRFAHRVGAALARRTGYLGGCNSNNVPHVQAYRGPIQMIEKGELIARYTA